MFDCLKSKKRRIQLGYGSDPIIPQPAGPQPATHLWSIGPVINGQNYSKGMPASTPDGSFDFPVGLGKSVNYVTKPGMAGPSLRMEYEVIGGPIVAEELPEIPPTISLYMECSDNDWQRDGGRWWSRATGSLIPGRHVLEANLTPDEWVSVHTEASELFAASMSRVAKVGFTLGGGEGKGHGVYATIPSRFVLHSFVMS
jgi:hypothetical protein